MKIHALISMVLLLAGVAVAGDRQREKYSGSAERTAKSRREKILAEIKKLGDHEWAGEY